MNSVKIAYIVCVSISEMFYLAGAILTPIYLTPGWYIWTVAFIVAILIQGVAFGNRLDSWNWNK